MTALDPAKAQTCNMCGVPMVPRRLVTLVPSGYRTHQAYGMCAPCYRISRNPREDCEPAMWPGAPVGDIYLPTFHRYAPPPPWTDDALCAQVDHDVFFPERGASTRAAKTICAACPVAAACLDYALANREQFGVWGGKSEPERAEMLRKRPA